MGSIENSQTCGQAFEKLRRQIYPPIPKKITERKKMLLDFVGRLFVIWPTSVTGFDGVPVRVYEPKKRAGHGAIIFIHGGGFVFWSARAFDALTREICKQSRLVLVSIDYRLAPEHRYPAAVNDCERAAVHFIAEAHKNYLVDPHKIVIMGDSAGGNLTAVTLQRLRKMDLPHPKLQVLIYPWMQMLDFQTPSYQMMEQYSRTAMISPDLIARFALYYLVGSDIGRYVPDVVANRHVNPKFRHALPFDYVRHDHLLNSCSVGGQHLYRAERSNPMSVNLELCNLLQPYLSDPDVSPLLHPSLEGSPKTMIVTVDYDPLRDDGILYTERLKDAGVQVVHKHYARGFHAMASYPVEQGRQLIKDVVEFINENL